MSERVGGSIMGSGEYRDGCCDPTLLPEQSCYPDGLVLTNPSHQNNYFDKHYVPSTKAELIKYLKGWHKEWKTKELNILSKKQLYAIFFSEWRKRQRE